MPNPFVVVDDTRVNLEGAGWDRQSSVESVYNATLSTLAATRGGTVGNVTLDYPAWSELRLVGRGSGDLRMNYTTGNETRPARFNISDPVLGKDTGLIWNVTSPLTDQRLSLRPSAGNFSLDYVAYRPQEDQVRKGDVVLLENTHPYIQYQGAWRQNITIPEVLPFSGQWLVATNDARIAPSFSTRFRGSHISVYGAVNHAAGDLNMVYAIDSEAPDTVSYDQGPFGVDATAWTVGLLYQKALDPTRVHRFDVYMDNWEGNQVFCLDYIAYEAVEDFQSTVPPPDQILPPIESGEGATRREGMSIRIGVGVAAGVLLLCLIGWRVYVHRARRIAQRTAPRQAHELQTIPARTEGEAPPPWSPPANPEGEPPPPVFEAIGSDPTVTDASHRSTQETRRSSVDSPPRYEASPAGSPRSSPRAIANADPPHPGLEGDATAGAPTTGAVRGVDA